MRFWEHDVEKNFEGCIESIESKVAQLRHIPHGTDVVAR